MVTMPKALEKFLDTTAKLGDVVEVTDVAALPSDQKKDLWAGTWTMFG